MTAHPDDEDGGTLAYESRGRGTRVALLTINRGEGGANVMSPDYFDALGLVRTAELLQSGRYYGVEQYFTRFADYGFSKTMQEAIDHWGREKVLYDFVRVVRMVRPLVITSVFVGGPSDGHGHHQTAGAMAQAVYKAAGDPNMFPDQIKAGLRPWSPVKDYARAPFFGRGGVNLSTNVAVPQGTYDPMLGASYAQIAREGLGYQKSQTGGSNIPKPGQINSAYHRFASTVSAGEKEKDFFDGIDISLPGIASLASGENGFLKEGLIKINAHVEDAMARFSAIDPARVASALASGMKETEAAIAAVERSGLSEAAKYDVLHELKIKRVQFNSALAECLGLSISATIAPDQEPNPRMAAFFGDPESFRVAIPGQSFGVKLHAVNSSAKPVSLSKLSIEASGGPAWTVTAPPTPISGELFSDTPLEARFRVKAPEDAALTRPYFSRPHIEQAFYDVKNEAYLYEAIPPYPLVAWADWSFEGVPVRIGQYVQTIKRVTGLGTVLEPLITGPAIALTVTPRSGIVPLDSKSFELSTLLRSNVKGPAKGSVRLDLPAGWKADPPSIDFETRQDGEDRALRFQVTPNSVKAQPYTITAVASYAGREYREGYTTTGYPGLRPYFLYAPASYKAVGTDVKVAPGLKVAYITGSGDDVPAALENLGIRVNFLTAADIAGGDLKQYDAIVLGVRTYAARPELATNNQRLLDYAKDGGVLIVQYNTPEYDHNFAPYPYSMTNNPEEVTDENSKVKILAPANPLLSWPNKISESDFEGWVEERGSKFFKTWDAKFEALLETQDPGQEPQRGGLLYAKYGKGVYVYNAYSFYRQLPEGVPGAFRLFANLVSLPKNPAIR